MGESIGRDGALSNDDVRAKEGRCLIWELKKWVGYCFKLSAKGEKRPSLTRAEARAGKVCKERKRNSHVQTLITRDCKCPRHGKDGFKIMTVPLWTNPYKRMGYGKEGQ